MLGNEVYQPNEILVEPKQSACLNPVSDDVESAIGNIEIHIDLMEKYCAMKLQAKDWHGVSDAANDIRELQSQLAVWKIQRGRVKWRI